MRISLIGPTHPFRGGIAHYTTLLFRNLRKRHSVRFFSFIRQYPRWLFPGSSDRDLSDKPINESGIDYTLDSLNPISWIQTAKAIRQYQPDLLIIPWWTAYWTLPFWIIANIIKRTTTIEILFLCHNVKEHESNWLSQVCTKWVLGQGDCFLVHSRAETTLLRQISPKAQIIQGFHPTYEDLQVVRYTRAEARQRLRVSGNVLLFFGFIRPYKGLDYLLDTVPAIAKEMDGDLTVLVVGECWQGEHEYQQQIKDLGIGGYVRRINHYVPNEDISLYFAATDLVIIPYVSATGSGVLQAALGAGRPVIASRIGALEEGVCHGRTGYLVPPANAPQLGRAIVDFFKEDNGPHFEREIQKEKDRFSWSRLVRIIENRHARDNSC